jgi:uncharacterized protein YciI
MKKNRHGKLKPLDRMGICFAMKSGDFIATGEARIMKTESLVVLSLLFWVIAPAHVFGQLPIPQSSSTPPLNVSATALFIVQFTQGDAWERDKLPQDQNGMKAHSDNLARLRGEGKLITGARFKDSHADKGMVILRSANRAEAESEFAADPMVVGKQFGIDVALFTPFYSGTIQRQTAVDTTKPLSKFAWLSGCWQGANGSVTFKEHWMPDAGNMMLGMSRTMKGEKVISFESIRLELDASGVPVYIPTPAGQKETRFTLLSEAAGKFVFENKTHDFPQRIIYQNNVDGSLSARIEGESGGKVRAVDFPMRRGSCD